MTINTIRQCSSYLITLIIFVPVVVHGLDEHDCFNPITESSETIKDEYYLASSTLDYFMYGPHKARPSENSRWCPGNNLMPPWAPQFRQWIEINLKDVFMIKALKIDATFLNSSRPDFQFYDFEYYRPKLDTWISKWRMFVADKNYTQSFNLKYPVWASKIRISPHPHFDEVPCISLELFGCLWTKGIVSYEMPVNNLGDKEMYDGKTENGLQKDGLGQLVDGLIVSENSLDTMDGWLAWKNDSLNGHPLQLTYQFDDLHKFQSVVVSVKFNEESKGFSCLEAYFSDDGVQYNNEHIRQYATVSSSLGIQSIEFDLKNHTGRFVILKLHFDGRWLYTSEINFESRIADPLKVGGVLRRVVVTTALLLCLLPVGLLLYFLISRGKCFMLCQKYHSLELSLLHTRTQNPVTRFYIDLPERNSQISDYMAPNEECYYSDGLYESIGYPKIGKQEDMS